MSYCEEKQISACLFSIDQENALDPVYHDYLFSVLQKFRLEEKFKNFILTKLRYSSLIRKLAVCALGRFRTGVRCAAVETVEDVDRQNGECLQESC